MDQILRLWLAALDRDASPLRGCLRLPSGLGADGKPLDAAVCEGAAGLGGILAVVIIGSIMSILDGNE